MDLVPVLVVAAGLSEAAGRLLPLVSRRPGMSRTSVVGLLCTGAIVEGAVVALWPLTAQATGELLSPSVESSDSRLAWSAGSVAPLLLAAIIAFPLLGPLLHLVLLATVGAGLATTLADASGVRWEVACVHVGIAGLVLAAGVAVVRRLVAGILAAGDREPAS